MSTTLRVLGRSGMTLIEVLTSLTVLGILSVGVSLLYVQALMMYRRGTREATAHDKAVLALERIVPEVREAFNVDFPGPDLLVLTMPKRGAGGHYQIDPATRSLVSGGQVAFYQSDATGSMATTGRYIWRARRPTPDAAWEPTGVLADEVEDLTFTYAPDADRVDLVRITITVGRGTQPGYFNRTEAGEVALRNH